MHFLQANRDSSGIGAVGTAGCSCIGAVGTAGDSRVVDLDPRSLDRHLAAGPERPNRPVPTSQLHKGLFGAPIGTLLGHYWGMFGDCWGLVGEGLFDGFLMFI